MKILLVGGGSGGHIMPLLAVAKDLKKQLPKLHITVVTERGGKFSHLAKGENVDDIKMIFAGKLRRYHGEPWYVRVFDIKRNLLNFRDIFRMIFGTIQSVWLLMRQRPAIVFIKGGYVGVPVGLAARLLRIPYITHDSDAVPGLTNRLIASHAVINAVGMPKNHYNYPSAKTVFVGVPVTDDFKEVTNQIKAKKRTELGLLEKAKILLITGGSNGAQRIDDAIGKVARDLLTTNSDLFIIHQVGQGNEAMYDDYPLDLKKRILVSTFLKPLSSYSAAADLVIARAGATAIAEFAAQRKACIVIPNPLLTGGHQLKNSEVLKKAGAAVVISESDMQQDTAKLNATINDLLANEAKRTSLSDSLHGLIPTNASSRLSNLIVEQLKGSR